MKFRPFIFYISYLLFIFSCGSKKTPDFGNFDLAAWKADPKGCKNHRKEQFEAFKHIKEEIKELSQNQIVEFFGKPDAQVLDDRNKKYFIYYFETGEQCQQRMTSPTLAQSVALRFNAVSLVTEVTFQMGNP